MPKSASFFISRQILLTTEIEACVSPTPPRRVVPPLHNDATVSRHTNFHSHDELVPSEDANVRLSFKTD